MNDPPPLALQNALDRAPQAKSTEPPYVDKLLMEYLELRYPSRNPGPEATLAQVQRYAGERQVIIDLRALYDKQE